MRVYDLALIAEHNRLESDHVLTCLFQVDIPGAPVPLRLANYDGPIVFHGLTYEPWPVNVDSVEDATSSSMTHLRIAPQNVSREMIALFETYWYDDQDWRVTMWHIDARQPDITNFESGNVYALMSSPTGLMAATFDLVAEGMTLNTLLPKRRYTTSGGFPRDPEKVEAMPSLPDIQTLVQPLIGLPYEHFQLPGPAGAGNACWGLVRHLLKAGFGFDLAMDTTSAAERFAEVWYRGSTQDPWGVLQPWDALVLATRSPLSDHVGLIVEPTLMVHVRQRVGVCVEPIRRWKPKLVQIVRLRSAW